VSVADGSTSLGRCERSLRPSERASADLRRNMRLSKPRALVEAAAPLLPKREPSVLPLLPTTRDVASVL